MTGPIFAHGPARTLSTGTDRNVANAHRASFSNDRYFWLSSPEKRGGRRRRWRNGRWFRGRRWGSTISAAQACEEMSIAGCSKLYECTPFTMSLSYPDEATCVVRSKLQCSTGALPNGSNGTPASIAACAAAVVAMSCEDLIAGVQPVACNIAGTLASGAACAGDDQCSSGFCKKSAVCGVCADKVASGVACTQSGECANGLACAGTGSKTCQPHRVVGASCSTMEPCRSDLYCHAGACAVPAKTVGASCVATEAGSCDSRSGLFCSPVASTCAAVTLAEVGSPCGFVGGTTVLCKSGAQCKYTGAMGLCVAHAADGASCDMSNAIGCLAPASCVNNVCTVPTRPTCP